MKDELVELVKATPMPVGQQARLLKELENIITQERQSVASEIKKGLEEELIWGQVRVLDLEKGEIEWTMRCLKDEEFQAYFRQFTDKEAKK